MGEKRGEANVISLSSEGDIGHVVAKQIQTIMGRRLYDVLGNTSVLPHSEDLINFLSEKISDDFNIS